MGMDLDRLNRPKASRGSRTWRSEDELTFAQWKRLAPQAEFIHELDAWTKDGADFFRSPFLESLRDEVSFDNKLSPEQVRVGLKVLEEYKVKLSRYRSDPDMLPPGFDEDIWKLTLAFHNRAESCGVELDTPYHMTYQLLRRSILRTKIRDRENWVVIVEQMIAEFWDNDVELANQAWAIEQFTGPETFKGLYGWVLRKTAPDPAWRTNDRSYLKDWPRAKPRMHEDTPVLEPRTYTDEEAAALRTRVRARIDAAMKEF
jgi:hypothetical protein